MPLWLVPVVPVCVQHSVLRKPVSTLPVFPSSSLPEVTLSLLRVVLTRLLESECAPLVSASPGCNALTHIDL